MFLTARIRDPRAAIFHTVCLAHQKYMDALCCIESTDINGCR